MPPSISSLTSSQTERRGGDIARAPTVVDPRIPTVSPTQSLQLCQESAETGATFRIVRGEAAEEADAPHPLPLLCASRKRPRCCTAHNAEKLPPPHNAPRESIVAVQTTTMIVAEGMPDVRLGSCVTRIEKGMPGLRSAVKFKSSALQVSF